jgi:hypothetical protein
VPKFHLEVDQEALGTVSLKNSCLNGDITFVAERQYPRDIEIEVKTFFSASTNLSIQEGYAKESIGEVWTLARIKDEHTRTKDQITSTKYESNLSMDQLVEENLLVSLNHGRPKKKRVSFCEENILFVRPNGPLNGAQTSVPYAEILLVTQRPSGQGNVSLTIFWSSDASFIYTIESAEIFFNNMDMLMTWKLELAKIQDTQLRGLPDTIENPSHVGELPWSTFEKKSIEM